MASEAITTVDIPSLEKIARGKVRDLFALPGGEELLFVSTDRTSAFDIVMANGVPGKGAVLTQLSAHWFRVLTEKLPHLRTHLVSLRLPADLPLSSAERAALRGRAMRVRRLRVFPIEAIVRGYLAGSSWAEYQRSGTMHGLPLPPGLTQCAALPRAMYTPSTKAPAGEHDENITPAQAAAIVGERYARRVEELALAAYGAARDWALERGIIIADTKFEFGLDEATDDVVLIDEVLTPDSSRFWRADKYQPGRDQESLDKQPLRDWLVREGLKGKEGVAMPDHVTAAMAARYEEAFKILTGRTVAEAMEAEGL